MHQLFVEIDQDGSGSIDKNEFRLLLRKLNLKYSNHRFELLFRAVDSVGGDGEISEPELVEFLFPGCSSDSSSDSAADNSESASKSQPSDAGSRKAAAWARTKGLFGATASASAPAQPHLASDESIESGMSKEGIAFSNMAEKAE